MFNDTRQSNHNNQSVQIDAQETLITVNKEFLFKIINAHLELIEKFRKQRTKKSLNKSKRIIKSYVRVKGKFFTQCLETEETLEECHQRLLKEGVADYRDGYHEYPCKCWTKMENRLKSLLLCPELETTIILPVSFYKSILEFSAFSREDGF